jgi:hypothetical protein
LQNGLYLFSFVTVLNILLNIDVKEKLSPLGIRVLSPLDKMFKNFNQEGVDFNNEMKEALKRGDYELVHKEMTKVRNRDLAACDLSTFLIAVVDVTKPNWGSVDEIITSKRNCKPVFLVIDQGYKNCPLWLTSYFKPNHVYDSLDKVIETIYDIDAGKIEINNKYWKIPEL